MARYLYSELASTLQAYKYLSAVKPGQHASMANVSLWMDKHRARIESLVKDQMPSGSGFDSGTTLDIEASHAEKLVFLTSFHHMNEVGYYDGWTEHSITVTPSLAHEIHLRISGRNRNDIKEGIHQAFHSALTFDISETWEFSEKERTILKAGAMNLDADDVAWLARRKARRALDEFALRVELT